MNTIIFNYKNHKYFLSFYPCGNMGNIKKDTGKITRDFKYDKNVTVSKFLSCLDKMDFGE